MSSAGPVLALGTSVGDSDNNNNNNSSVDKITSSNGNQDGNSGVTGDISEDQRQFNESVEKLRNLTRKFSANVPTNLLNEAIEGTKNSSKENQLKKRQWVGNDNLQKIDNFVRLNLLKYQTDTALANITQRANIPEHGPVSASSYEGIKTFKFFSDIAKKRRRIKGSAVVLHHLQRHEASEEDPKQQRVEEIIRNLQSRSAAGQSSNEDTTETLSGNSSFVFGSKEGIESSRLSPKETYKPYDKQYILSLISSYESALNWNINQLSIQGRESAGTDGDFFVKNLNPVQCALNGWKCLNANRLYCITCSKSFILKFPEFSYFYNNKSTVNVTNAKQADGKKEPQGSEDSDAEYEDGITENLAKAYYDQLHEMHHRGCPWFLRPAQVATYDIGPANQGFEVHQFEKRFAETALTLSDATSGQLNGDSSSGIKFCLSLPLESLNTTEFHEAVQQQSRGTEQFKNGLLERAAKIAFQWIATQRLPSTKDTSSLSKKHTYIQEDSKAFLMSLLGWSLAPLAPSKHVKKLQKSQPHILSCDTCTRKVLLEGEGNFERTVDLIGEHNEWCCFVKEYELLSGPERVVADIESIANNSTLRESKDREFGFERLLQLVRSQLYEKHIATKTFSSLPSELTVMVQGYDKLINR